MRKCLSGTRLFEIGVIESWLIGTGPTERPGIENGRALISITPLSDVEFC
jgi:hypothetical protein